MLRRRATSAIGEFVADERGVILPQRIEIKNVQRIAAGRLVGIVVVCACREMARQRLEKIESAPEKRDGLKLEANAVRRNVWTADRSRFGEDAERVEENIAKSVALKKAAGPRSTVLRSKAEW